MEETYLPIGGNFSRMRQAAPWSYSTPDVDDAQRSSNVKTSTMILIALLVLLAAALPIWKHSKVWGYTPSVWLGLMIAAHFYTVITSP